MSLISVAIPRESTGKGTARAISLTRYGDQTDFKSQYTFTHTDSDSDIDTRACLL